MSAVAIEVADSGLLTWSRTTYGGRSHGSSPGYALADGAQVRVGREAASQAHVKPKQLATRFWEVLEPEPVGKPFPQGTTHADLAHAHLRAAWEACRGGQEVVLAVPGFRTERQLGLLLGIARSLEIPVVGLVDSAVAVAQGYPAATLVHLDLHLHRAVATCVRRTNGELLRDRVETAETAGQIAVHEACARVVEQAFVAQTRFDPAHAGESEQALHDALPAWLAALQGADRVAARLRFAGHEHEVVVERAAMLAAMEGVTRVLLGLVSRLRASGEPATILLSARAAAVPGLADRLRRMPRVEVVSLQPEAVAAGALLARTQAEPGKGGSVPLLTRLQASAAPEPPADEPEAAAEVPAARMPGAPSHLLLGSTLYRLESEALVLGTAPPRSPRAVVVSGETFGVSRAHCRAWVDGEVAWVEDESSFGTFVNGEKVTGRARLQPGDRLRLGTPGIELVVVAEAGS